MHQRLHAIDRTAAEWMFWVLEILLLLLAAVRAQGQWVLPLLYAACAAAVAIRRMSVGVQGPPLVEITDTDLVWRSTFYIPPRRETHSLPSIRTLTITGPSGYRRFTIVKVDGSVHEFRPHYSRRLETRVLQFLNDRLPPAIRVTEEAPSGVLARMRGR